jgi:hypothetical protein
MSGLSSDQIVDYLIIGLITSIFAGLVDLFLKRNDVKGKTRTAAVTSLIVVAVGIGYWRLRERSKEEANIRGGGGTSHGTAGSHAGTPPMTPSQTPTQTPTSTPTRESYVDSFVREKIAPPGKGLRRSGQWAVIITEPGSQENYSKLASVVSSVIGEAGHSTVAIFRPSATHGAGFDALFAADPALSRQLNEYCDQILLGKVTSSIQENPSYPGLHSLTMTIDVKIISTSSGDVQQIQASAVGAGYEIGEARSNAEERLAANLRSELHNVIK